MKTLRAQLERLAGLFYKRRLDRELDAEFESHLRMQIDDNIRRGMSTGEARRQALLRSDVRFDPHDRYQVGVRQE